MLIVAMALPVLRPLRFTKETDIATDEYLRLVTIRQIADKGTLRLPEDLPAGRRVLTLPQPGGGLVAAQEPMLAVLAAPVYKGLVLCRASFAKPRSVGFYLVTLIVSTIPTAVTASLLYRAGRLLDLGRSRRIAIAFATAGCTGLLPFAAVVSPYPLAAMCAAGALTALAQAAMNRPPPAGAGWMILAGLLAATGAAVHPSVAALAVALGLCTLLMPWRRRIRVLGLILFLLGASVPVSAHRGLTRAMNAGWTVPAPMTSAVGESAVPSDERPVASGPDEELPPAKTRWDAIVATSASIGGTLVGRQGLLLFAPATLLGTIGVRRLLAGYWPKTTRGLGVASVIGFFVPLALWGLGPMRSDEAMYGPQYLVAASPCLMLFAGVLFRHGWAPARTFFPAFVIYLMFAVSLAAGLVGLLHPYKSGGYRTYAPIEVIRELARPR